ncbi:MAG: hypothetical protein HYW97_00530 [Candidatus Wildermuthbacteria bacterium]|nr:hypothetical protein [Candidatus Wildermuthbacteria bacterium]
MDKSLFYRHYANLPIPTRKDIALTIDEKPISWDVAYREIDADTELGKRILEKLFQLGFIPKE